MNKWDILAMVSIAGLVFSFYGLRTMLRNRKDEARRKQRDRLFPN